MHFNKKDTKELLAVGLLFVLFFTFYCNSRNKESVKDDNGKIYNNYIDACTDNNFEAAYKLLEKKGSRATFSEHFYVFEKETAFLAGINDEQSTKRLLYLVKEEEAALGEKKESLEFFYKHINKLMSLGAATDNIDLVRGIYKQFSGNYLLIPDLSVIEFLAKQKTFEDNQLIIMHDKGTYEFIRRMEGSQVYLNHVDVAIMAQNSDLAKGLIEFLNTKDKAEAKKKYDAAVKAGAFK